MTLLQSLLCFLICPLSLYRRSLTRNLAVLHRHCYVDHPTNAAIPCQAVITRCFRTEYRLFRTYSHSSQLPRKDNPVQSRLATTYPYTHLPWPAWPAWPLLISLGLHRHHNMKSSKQSQACRYTSPGPGDYCSVLDPGSPGLHQIRITTSRACCLLVRTVNSAAEQL